MDGISEPDLAWILDESVEQVHARVPPPEWLRTLREAFEGYRAFEGPTAGWTELAESWPDAVFLGTLDPLISKARRDLLLRIDDLFARWPRAPIHQESVTASLVGELSKQFLPKLAQTYALELQISARLGRLSGTTPRERFETFVSALRQPYRVLSLMEEYCVLARELARIIEQWLNASVELLERVCADWPEITAYLLPDDSESLLKAVRTDRGDRHRDGRSVAVLTFSSQSQLVYKPRSFSLDLHFQQLLQRFNAYGAQPPLKSMRVIDKGAYGWAEFIVSRDCSSAEEVGRFYESAKAPFSHFFMFLKRRTCTQVT